MTAVRAAIFALLGFPIGSFLTVVIHRVPAGESIVAPRSRCSACGTQLRGRDNVPVASWIVLRGRCRSCGVRISPLYPAIEVATAALFAGAALEFESWAVAPMMAAFLGLMPPIAAIDIRHRIIPNRIVYPAFVAFTAWIVAWGLLGGGVDVARAFAGSAAYAAPFFVIALVAPAGMGMGDVKLNALIGLVLGSLGLSYVAVAAGAGILLGGLGAIAALLAGVGRKQTVPFGPYLAAGAVVAAFLAPPIADAYLRLFR